MFLLQLGVRRVYFTAQFTDHQEVSQGRNSRQTQNQLPGGTLLTRLLLVSHSACLMQPGTTCPGMPLPTGAGLDPSTLIINQVMPQEISLLASLAASSQLKFPLPRGL